MVKRSVEARREGSAVTAGPEFVVDFPTLRVVCDWIEQHCPVPDGFRAGGDMELYPWQLWCTANHYRVRTDATLGQLARAFTYRRSQVVAPQKALALDTPIATPDGWTTMAEVQPGDFVFDERGPLCQAWVIHPVLSG